MLLRGGLCALSASQAVPSTWLSAFSTRRSITRFGSQHESAENTPVAEYVAELPVSRALSESGQQRSV